MATSPISLEHAVPGRVRVKVPRVRSDARFAQELRQRFATIDGVRRIEINPITGSVILHYDDDQMAPIDFLHALADAFRAAFPGLEARLEHWLREERQSTRRGPLANRITDFCATLDAGVERVAGEGINLRVLLPISFVVVGLGRMTLTKRTPVPNWYDFFWYAFNMFVTFNAPSPSVEAGSADD